MATSSQLSAEEIAAYRATARQRHQREQQAVAARKQRAWVVAREAAARLRQAFRVRRVVVFGSLVHPGCFTAWSDIDMAAWGIAPAETFRAIGMAMDTDAEIAVNLVDAGACSASLLRVIERDGDPL